MFRNWIFRRPRTHAEADDGFQRFLRRIRNPTGRRPNRAGLINDVERKRHADVPWRRRIS
jgi:hypothetical protein